MGFMKVNAANAMALAAIQQKTTQYLHITQEEPRIYMTVFLIHAFGSGSYLYWSINAATVQMALTLGMRRDAHNLATVCDFVDLASGLWLRVAAIVVVIGRHTDRHGCSPAVIEGSLAKPDDHKWYVK